LTSTPSRLDTRRERQERLAAACGVELGRDAYMFSTEPDGSQPLHPDTVTGGFRRVCERLGLKGVRLHDLRHLHATQLLAAGVPVRTVSGRLGHANDATTLNVYAAFVEASDRNAASVIGGLLTTRDDGSAASDHTGGPAEQLLGVRSARSSSGGEVDRLPSGH
jgi:integrase